MEPSLLDKLVTEVRRYQNKDFLKAAIGFAQGAEILHFHYMMQGN